MDVSDFVSELLDHPIKRLWSILAVLGESKNFALERRTDTIDSVSHLGTLLVDQYVDWLCLHITVVVLDRKTLIMEASQDFATWRPEDELLELTLLRVVYGTTDVSDGNAKRA